MEAIERIAGYACEVNEEQWRELVKVADEVGAPVFRKNWIKDMCLLIVSVHDDGEIIKDTHFKKGRTLIPYHDFLAKLKGEEKWEPKNGEEVEVQYFPKQWISAIYVGRFGDLYVCKGGFECGSYFGFADARIRPLRPTITRAEAEQKLKELGVIARIVD